MGEKIHGNAENRPQTTIEEKPKRQPPTADTLKKFGKSAIKNAQKK